ncbi:hypothetical protein ACFOYW_14305 [Gryllotalpicola reticulitermitis]|uniref:Uncharacterized protein n=2 Tax=Gryllotalpicola reticulitermitis TaxID=1184153 RepID=A0ABV8Q863_9MICO
MALDGELRDEPQFDARGGMFRFELRDLDAERVFYGPSESYLLATQIPGYPVTEFPLVADLAIQFADRRAFAIDLTTALQARQITRFEEQSVAGAVYRMPARASRVLHGDKRRPVGIHVCRHPIPLVVLESSALFSTRPALRAGNVIIIRDLDERSLLEDIAAAHGLALVERDNAK